MSAVWKREDPTTEGLKTSARPAAEHKMAAGQALSLPAGKTDSRARGRGKKRREDVAPRRRVLVVDDDHDFAEGLKELLEMKFYDVEMAHHPGEALEIFHRFQPSVALLDIRLGPFNGVDLISNLKELSPEIICVLMTANAELETALAAVKKGAYDYLRKPLDIENLLRLLARCFNHQELKNEKEEAQRLLEENRRLLQAVIDTIPYSISLTDPRGTLTLANLAFERARQESDGLGLGTPGGDFSPDQEKLEGELHVLFERALKTGETVEMPEIALTRPSGPTSFYRVQGIPITDDQGTPTGVVRILENITSRKHTEILKDEFISTLNHELRTPLTSIIGSLGIVLGLFSDEIPAEARELLEVSQRNSDQLVNLINDLLDIKKIEAGNLSLTFQPLEMAEMLRHAVALNNGYAKKFDIPLELITEGPALHVMGDWERLLQVLSNLISNAVKFSTRGCPVIVELGREGKDWARTKVTDQGGGIPIEFQPRVFQKFSQADSSDRRFKGGTGLGLNISKSIVERHGGKIDFVSVPTEGSCFFFDLPLHHPTGMEPA